MCAGQEALGTLCTFLSIPKTTLKNKVIKKKKKKKPLCLPPPTTTCFNTTSSGPVIDTDLPAVVHTPLLTLCIPQEECSKCKSDPVTPWLKNPGSPGPSRQSPNSVALEESGLCELCHSV